MSISWKLKPTPEFWRTVIITVIIGFAAGALGALVMWSRMVAYETVLRVTNQPTQLGIIRRTPTRERGLIEALDSLSTRSVVSFFEKKAAPDARYLPEEALGRGLVFTSDGWLVSHRSSFDPRRRATMLAGIGPFLVPIEKIVEDTETGVLFVKVVQDHLDPVVFAERVGEPGEQVFAVGAPHGVTLNWITMPRARATSYESSDELRSALVFRDSFPKNLAGSPIFNEDQEVLGVATADAGVVTSAVPATYLEPLFAALLAEKSLERPALGVRGLSLADSRRARGERERGFLVTRDPVTGARAVVVGGPAGKAGIVAEDVIVKLNDTVLNGLLDLAELLLAFRPGEELDLTILRNGDELVLPVTLGSRIVGHVYE